MYRGALATEVDSGRKGLGTPPSPLTGNCTSRGRRQGLFATITGMIKGHGWGGSLRVRHLPSGQYRPRFCSVSKGNEGDSETQRELESCIQVPSLISLSEYMLVDSDPDRSQRFEHSRSNEIRLEPFPLARS